MPPAPSSPSPPVPPDPAAPAHPALDYLDRHHVVTLATHGADGPWAAAVFYARDGARLYFLSAASTRHARNLAAELRCAATIQDDCADWAAIKGVQLEGVVAELHGPALAHARACYGAKFPLVTRLGGAPAAIVQALARVHWYALQVQRLYFIDNSRGFGHREAVELPDGAASASYRMP